MQNENVDKEYPQEYFPLKLEPREQQLDMLNFSAWSINHMKKNILINAPTGSGKSYFAIMLINWYLNNVDSQAKIDILTNTKVLQQQYLDDYKFITNLMGKSNYICDKFDTDCEKGMELCSALGTYCNNCPYKVQKNLWQKSQISLTNFHLFNSFAVFNQEPLQKRESTARLLIIDESHDFESVFSDFLTVNLNVNIFKACGFEHKEVEKLDKKISQIKTLENCVSFLQDEYFNRLNELRKHFEKEIENNSSSKKSVELSRYIKNIDTELPKLRNFIGEYERKNSKNDNDVNPKDNWVLDVNKIPDKKKSTRIELSIKPVWVNKYLYDYVWKRYDHIVFMSGTLLNKEIFSYINGLIPKYTTFKSFDSTFPVKNRPIYYIKCGKMTYKEKKESFNLQKKYIEKILKRNKNNKGIVHANTYEFSNWIKETIFDERLIFHKNIDRQDKYKEFINSEKPKVLVSPSMHTGIDLKDDMSRFQVLMKIPYPNISSNKIKQRQKTYKEWYNWKTVVDLVQALGRSVRSKNDYAESYILDSSLSLLLRYNGYLIPRYISDAIKEIKK